MNDSYLLGVLAVWLVVWLYCLWVNHRPICQICLGPHELSNCRNWLKSRQPNRKAND